MSYLSTAAAILSRHSDLIDRVQPGEFGCTSCKHIGPKAELRPGRGRSYGEHPEHRYCKCGRSIDWNGYVDGDIITYLARCRTSRAAQPQAS